LSVNIVSGIWNYIHNHETHNVLSLIFLSSYYLLLLHCSQLFPHPLFLLDPSLYPSLFTSFSPCPLLEEIHLQELLDGDPQEKRALTAANRAEHRWWLSPSLQRRLGDIMLGNWPLKCHCVMWQQQRHRGWTCNWPEIPGGATLQ
ncbi:hypothetical protein AOLI_G00068370, partial [Acnodon oligacanthus]